MKTKIQIATLLSLLVAGCGGSGSSPAPGNLAPTISAIADQNTTANEQSAAIAFTVTDEQASNLSISASSDRQQVVPDSELVLGGSGTMRSVTITPVIDTLGDAFITIIVTDQAGLSASTSFLLTVVPQQVSLQQFVRTTFADAEDGDPALINAIAFDQDADNDDFADLLAQ